MPNSVPYFYWTLVFEWYVVRCGSKNKYQKNMCLKEIGLRAQNMLLIISSRVNINGKGETCMTKT
jgi:hypothetical protein